MDISVAVSAGIMNIAFDRPGKKNAITAAMYQALAEALQAGQTDASVRAIMIEGTRDVFTAGNDLEDFRSHPPHGASSPVFQFLHAISHTEKPLIAVVCGPAVGVGTTMLLHCDLVFAGENARFKLPFTQLGLVPEAGSSFLLPQLVGYQHAAELLLLGEEFDAARAQAMGLVNRVLPVESVRAHALSQAEKLVRLPAAALRATKRLLHHAQQGAVESQMAVEGEAFRQRLGSPEAREAFSAFFERRKPDFSQFG